MVYTVIFLVVNTILFIALADLYFKEYVDDFGNLTVVGIIVYLRK
jgi:hypothetical protein